MDSGQPMYVVFARKYRPQRFEDVVGQGHIARTLQNAVRTGRVAHAYLFCGPRGIGKTTMARILARALNCQQGPTPEPCGRCDACRRIAVGEDMDVIEIDGASNRGIDEVRELRRNARLVPAHGRFKIYYIDEVHMLTQEAFNALLKTLEEPPSHVKFIFSTTDPQRLPETVKSRCQRFDFRRISDADIVDRLRHVCTEEGLEVEDATLAVIARAARGSMRDALGTLDQLAAFGESIRMEDALSVLGAVDQQVLARLVDALAAEDTAGALGALHEALLPGTDVEDLADQLSLYLRDLLIAGCCGPEDPMLAGAVADGGTLRRQSALFTTEQLTYMIQLLREAKLRARRDTTGRIALELAVVKISRLSDLVTIEQALDGLSGGSAAAPTDARRAPQQEQSPVGALRRMKEKLKNSKQGQSAPGPRNRATGIAEEAPRRARAAANGRPKPSLPEGMTEEQYRRLAACVEDPAALPEALAQQPLMKAFVKASQALGLRPVRLERQAREQPEEPGEDEAPEEDKD